MLCYYRHSRPHSFMCLMRLTEEVCALIQNRCYSQEHGRELSEALFNGGKHGDYGEKVIKAFFGMTDAEYAREYESLSSRDKTDIFGLVLAEIEPYN